MKRSVVLFAVPLVLVACALVAGKEPRWISFPLQQTLVDRLADDVERVHDQWKRASVGGIGLDASPVEQTARAGWLVLRAQMLEVEGYGWITDAGLRSEWDARVRNKLRQMQTQFEGESKVDLLSHSDFQVLVAQLEADLAAGRSAIAIERYRSIETRVGVPPGDPRYDLRTKAKGLVQRARVKKEFDDMGLRLSGVVLNEDGRSGVLLNGHCYEVGDWINDQLKVQAIDRNRVEFIYKGQSFAKPW